MESRVPGWTMQSLQDPLLEHGLLPYMATKEIKTDFTDDEPLITDWWKEMSWRGYQKDTSL